MGDWERRKLVDTFLLPFGSFPSSRWLLLMVAGLLLAAFYSLLGVSHSLQCIENSLQILTFYSLLGVSEDYESGRISYKTAMSLSTPFWEFRYIELLDNYTCPYCLKLSTPFWEFLVERAGVRELRERLRTFYSLLGVSVAVQLQVLQH